MSTDPYKILGVSRTDEKSTIKKAYHKLALKYHPDKNPSPDAAESFKKITEAYTQITNPTNMLEEFPDLSELFSMFSESMFGDAPLGAMFGGQGKQLSAKAYLSLTLEELYSGGEFEVEYNSKFIKGMKPMDVSPEIQGVVNMMGSSSFQAVFMVPDEEIITGKTKVVIEPGFNTNNPLVINNFLVDQNQDLVIYISEKKHKTFTRHNNNLEIVLNLSLKEALTGFERSITHLDGRTLDIQGKSVISPNTVKRIEEEGMNLIGCLIIKFVIEFPVTISDETKEELIKLL